MTQNYKGHWVVEIIPDPGNPHRPAADPNGIHYGVQFADGFAYVNWKQFGAFETGEEGAYIAIQSLGRDGRFEITEIAAKDYPPYGSK